MPRSFIALESNTNLCKDKQVIADAGRMVGEHEDSGYIPSDPKEFCNRILHTCYMGTENSSRETRERAKDLAEAVGRYITYHCTIS